MKNLKDLIVDFMGDVIRNGGILADKIHAEERLEICKECDFYQDVRPLPLIKTKGCKQCGCIIQIKVNCIENIDIKTGKMVTTRCGNVEQGGDDFWEHIDKKYQYNI
jgi:hypothetical protein